MKRRKDPTGGSSSFPGGEAFIGRASDVEFSTGLALATEAAAPACVASCRSKRLTSWASVRGNFVALLGAAGDKGVLR